MLGTIKTILHKFVEKVFECVVSPGQASALHLRSIKLLLSYETVLSDS